jgi:chromosome segregation ATPase
MNGFLSGPLGPEHIVAIVTAVVGLGGAVAAGYFKLEGDRKGAEVKKLQAAVAAKEADAKQVEADTRQDKVLVENYTKLFQSLQDHIAFTTQQITFLYGQLEKFNEFKSQYEKDREEWQRERCSLELRIQKLEGEKAQLEADKASLQQLIDELSRRLGQVPEPASV